MDGFLTQKSEILDAESRSFQIENSRKRCLGRDQQYIRQNRKISNIL